MMPGDRLEYLQRRTAVSFWACDLEKVLREDIRISVSLGAVIRSFNASCIINVVSRKSYLPDVLRDISRPFEDLLSSSQGRTKGFKDCI